MIRSYVAYGGENSKLTLPKKLMDAEEGRRKLMTLTNCRSTMYIMCTSYSCLG